MERGHNGDRYFIVDHGGMVVSSDGDVSAKKYKNTRYHLMVAGWTTMPKCIPSDTADEDGLFIANEQSKIQAALVGTNQGEDGRRFNLAECLEIFLDGVEKVTRHLRRKATGEVGCGEVEERAGCLDRPEV